MNDDYQKMSELLDKWLSDNEKGIKLAFIEKEILLEKVRKLYVALSAVETEEYAAPQPEVVQTAAPETAPKRNFTPAKTLEEDVDLFFDTEHESYKAVEQELEHIAKEINEAQEQPVVKEPEMPKVETPEPDIFDQIEKKEEPERPKDAPLTDNSEELFIEPDFEITAQPETQEVPVKEAVKKEEPVVVEKKPVVEEKPVEVKEEDLHEEDDILQFIPPKSTPARPTPAPAKQNPVTEKPKAQQTENQLVKEEKPQKESPLQKPPQRSLNDLFNERREDHSISSQYQHAKVGDLTKAISINDKFIYIKELFHNRGEDFSAAIRQLNECRNMEEAFDCLEQLKQKFFWDSKSDAYLSFCDLLRRKYS